MFNVKTGTEFLQLETYIHSIFRKNCLLVYTPSDKLLIEELPKIINKGLIVITDEVITGNLRMIESYYPEMLAHLCLNNLNKSQSLLGLINKMAKNHFIYKPPSFAKRVITYRFIDLIRAILYSDFFTKVWDGQFINNRVFVKKDNSELKYFTLYESIVLAKAILENITVESKVVGSVDNYLQVKLNFVLNTAVIVDR